MPACGASQQGLVRRASFDLGCAPGKLTVLELDGGTYGVRGCGKKASYVERCSGPKGQVGTTCRWVMDNRTALARTSPRPAPRRAAAPPPRRAASAAPPPRVARAGPRTAPPGATKGPQIHDDPGVNEELRRLLHEAWLAKIPKYTGPPKIHALPKVFFFYRWFKFRCATGSCDYHGLGIMTYPSSWFANPKTWWKLLRVGLGLTMHGEDTQKRSKWWQHNIGLEVILAFGMQYPWYVTPYFEFRVGLGALHRNIYNKDFIDFSWSSGFDFGVEAYLYGGFHLALSFGWKRSMVDIGKKRFFVDSGTVAVGFGF